MYSVAGFLRKLSANVEPSYWNKLLFDRFGFQANWGNEINDPLPLLKELYQTLRPIPPDLVKACNVSGIKFKFLGENRPYYPNHGFYNPGDKSITLNADIFWHPDYPSDFVDYRGLALSRFKETLIHEIGHAADSAFGDISLKPAWTKLSGWSETEKPGFKRLIINEPGTPKVVGEWFYSPSASFTRSYASRNPWDDFADSFAYFVCGMRNKIPAEKNGYFDELLQKYYV